MADISFKKFLTFLEAEGEPTEQQIDEIFGIFKNNEKAEKLKAQRKALVQQKTDLLRKQNALKNKKAGMGDEEDPSGERGSMTQRSRQAQGRHAERDWVAGLVGESLTEAKAKNVVLKVKLPADKFKGKTDKQKEDLIFGEEEGDDSWAQNQDVVTIEYIDVKGDTLSVHPFWSDDLDTDKVSKVQAQLQRSFDRWARSQK